MGRIIPVFLPFFACGNRCTFCDQMAITGIRPFSKDDIIIESEKQIKTWLARSNSWQEIAFYGGNFGAMEEEIRLSLYKLAYNYNISKIRFSTRPDTINSKLLKEIETWQISCVELGIQSLDNNVLKANNRPYTKDDAIKAIIDIANICNCGVQLMTGMYKQDIKSAIEDAYILSKYNIKTARIYPTLVFKNTELYNIFLRGDYKSPSFSDTIFTVLAMYIYFTTNDIKVIRIGLPIEAQESGDIMAGIYHNSLGDIIKTICVLLYYNIGKQCNFAGYKGIVKKIFKDEFSKTYNIDFKEICTTIRSDYFENSWGLFERAAYKFIKRLPCETNYR